MNTTTLKILTVLLLLFTPGMLTCSWAAARLTGDAELSYVQYDAAVDGKEVYSGTTFAQKFGLTYTATNLLFRAQPRYYSLKIGYNWVNYNTRITDLDQEVNLKQSYGKLKYGGEVGFTAAELPISVRAFVNKDQPMNTLYNLNSAGLIPDGLIYGITGRGKSIGSGFAFAFEPDMSRNATLQGLPRLLLNYHESSINLSEGNFKLDVRTRELAFGLNKQNNWINYRATNYENFLDPQSNNLRQQFQIGLIDHVGRRKWSTLTNWIDFSADGQLMTTKTSSQANSTEEYDVNLMLLASRTAWSARTFMNYNRVLDAGSINESARIPVYLKGTYGNNTDWYASLAANRVKETLFSDNSTNSITTAASHSISLGATTFKRSSFTLAPSIGLQTSKSSYGIDSYSLDSSVQTASTRRFSDRLGLNASMYLRLMDDGTNSAQSNSWSSGLDFNSTYVPDNMFKFTFQDKLEYGNGSGFIPPDRLSSSAATSSKTGDYLRNTVHATAGLSLANFGALIDGSYDTIKVTDRPASNDMTMYGQASYTLTHSSFRYDSKFQRMDNGYSTTYSYKNIAEVQYRPDRYNDGLFRFTDERGLAVDGKNSRQDIMQRYTYNFFTRTGVIRKIATFSEEYQYTRSSNYGANGTNYYLMLTGRYNPTERLSLYGSTRYENGSPGSAVMCYSAGINADFRLLSTSLDYSMAKRDSDNRLERKLAATVRRTF